tara:strand:+ start:369 stop:734 length:366 start_codon:yes stop_codon:yes gene_type:complete
MTTPKEKIKKQLEANKNLKNKILGLKGIRGDKPTKVKTLSKRKTPKKKSTGAIMKQVGNIFAKDDDLYANSTATAEDFTTNFGGSGFEVGGGYYKKGGRLKNAGKRKRAALRGQRSELRGS